MKTLTTEHGSYPVTFAWANDRGILLIQMQDPRPLPQVAAEFDGLQADIIFEDTDVGLTYTWPGFSTLEMIQRLPEDAVQMRLVRKA